MGKERRFLESTLFLGEFDFEACEKRLKIPSVGIARNC